MQFSLDQRRYRLNMSCRQLWEECNRRGRTVSYDMVRKVINQSGEVLYHTEKKIVDTLAEIEMERGMTDIEF